MNEKSKADVTLRHAIPEDSKDCFTWRNDPQTRAMFINSDPVAWDDHCTWFDSVLFAPDRSLLIGLANGKKIGTVRYDLDPQENRAEISVTIAPHMRGQGIAHKLITGGEAELPEQIKILIARIKPENTASRRAFEKAGYTEQTAEQNEDKDPNGLIVYSKKV